MSAKLLSQNLSAVNNDGRNVLISIAEMDSISIKLIRLGTLEMYSSLLERQVSDLKLAKVKTDTLILSLKATITNQQLIINNFEDVVMEYETIIESEQSICKIEKKQIRKRWMLIGGSGTIGGLVVGLILGLLAN
jgi:hypothetical protein